MRRCVASPRPRCVNSPLSLTQLTALLGRRSASCVEGLLPHPQLCRCRPVDPRSPAPGTTEPFVPRRPHAAVKGQPLGYRSAAYQTARPTDRYQRSRHRERQCHCCGRCNEWWWQRNPPGRKSVKSIAGRPSAGRHPSRCCRHRGRRGWSGVVHNCHRRHHRRRAQATGQWQPVTGGATAQSPHEQSAADGATVAGEDTLRCRCCGHSGRRRQSGEYTH